VNNATAVLPTDIVILIPVMYTYAAAVVALLLSATAFTPRCRCS
jgi:hypothetical protein